jgi:hypothetical protein
VGESIGLGTPAARSASGTRYLDVRRPVASTIHDASDPRGGSAWVVHAAWSALPHGTPPGSATRAWRFDVRRHGRPRHSRPWRLMCEDGTNSTGLNAEALTSAWLSLTGKRCVMTTLSEQPVNGPKRALLLQHRELSHGSFFPIAPPPLLPPTPTTPPPHPAFSRLNVRDSRLDPRSGPSRYSISDAGTAGTHYERLDGGGNCTQPCGYYPGASLSCSDMRALLSHMLSLCTSLSHTICTTLYPGAATN